MLDYMEQCLLVFQQKLGWNENNTYTRLRAPSQSLLDFPVGHGLAVSYGRAIAPGFKSAITGGLFPSAWSLSYLTTSYPFRLEARDVRADPTWHAPTPYAPAGIGGVLGHGAINGRSDAHSSTGSRLVLTAPSPPAPSPPAASRDAGPAAAETAASAVTAPPVASTLPPAPVSEPALVGPASAATPDTPIPRTSNDPVAPSAPSASLSAPPPSPPPALEADAPPPPSVDASYAAAQAELQRRLRHERQDDDPSHRIVDDDPASSVPPTGDGRPYLLYGRVFDDLRIEGLYARQVGPHGLLQVSGVNRLAPSPAAAAAIGVQYINQRPSGSVEVAYLTDGAALGLSALYRLGRTPLAVGGEVWAAVRETSGNISVGARYDATDTTGVPAHLALMASPMMGHASVAYTTSPTPRLRVATRYDVNVYSYESDWAIGFSFLPGAADGPMLKARFSVTDGFGLKYMAQCRGGLLGIGVESRWAPGTPAHQRQSVGLEFHIF
ncbi:hypothetical protein CXG81DRAFT_24014 [Caulochytrium protostelioides]|uniref:Mitochondrial distribution and morphology protein 10 n=1 Tax=Caulochytrium protostelioides TaxID=1555241 RepID=A0A4V1IVA3_9FUNG|nr:hypothetical protein CXG81DRAFT_24014 [Caulochytrium protostelioides]|eukprot:RKP03359.1 hypothetical protein CXG81DRAFT_24014 [Caulochytrium protostelioides]